MEELADLMAMNQQKFGRAVSVSVVKNEQRVTKEGLKRTLRRRCGVIMMNHLPQKDWGIRTEQVHECGGVDPTIESPLPV